MEWSYRFGRLIVTQILTILMCFSGFYPSVLGALFESKTLASSYLERYETDYKADVSVKCAVECARRLDWSPKCRGYQYNDVTASCEFYTDGANLGGGLTLFLWKMKDIFHTVDVNGNRFSIYLSPEKKDFISARTACQGLGGYLQELDSLDEYKAVQMVASGVLDWAFIGANDYGGSWVKDRDGQPISEDLMLWPASGSEPTNQAHEDCAIINPKKMELYDAWCHALKWFICERDL